MNIFKKRNSVKKASKVNPQNVEEMMDMFETVEDDMSYRNVNINNHVNYIPCNQCEGKMTYRDYKGTHLFICNDCPNCSFQYYGTDDVKNFSEYMDRRTISVELKQHLTGLVNDCHHDDDMLIASLYKMFENFHWKIHKYPYLRSCFLKVAQYMQDPDQFKDTDEVLEPMFEVIY